MPEEVLHVNQGASITAYNVNDAKRRDQGNDSGAERTSIESRDVIVNLSIGDSGSENNNRAQKSDSRSIENEPGAVVNISNEARAVNEGHDRFSAAAERAASEVDESV